MKLCVSDNRRYLVHRDGRPFFYLGDTAWELFHRCDREEAERYLANRAAKGFNVIQAVALAELDGLTTPNPYGELPLVDGDPARPREAYFEHVDYVVRRANALGLWVGFLPTWGRWVVNAGWTPPRPDEPVFTPENARCYGRFLGERYRDAQLIWILGGDRQATGVEAVWRAMAEGLAEGDGGTHLMTYHPYGPEASSTWFHDEPWLDLNMIQSGHSRRAMPNYRMIAADYARLPTKPVFDGEPCYEDMAVGMAAGNGYFGAHDVRQAAYWGVLSGGCGHTYGCNNIWQMFKPGRQPVLGARRSWVDSLDLEGAFDMRHVAALALARPYLTRFPAPELVLAGSNGFTDHVEAARDGHRDAKDAGYIMAYTPMLNRHLTLDTSCLRGGRLRAWWYDPREGVALDLGESPNSGVYTPPAPDSGPDWALVIDSVDAGYGPPGQAGCGC